MPQDANDRLPKDWLARKQDSSVRTSSEPQTSVIGRYKGQPFGRPASDAESTATRGAETQHRGR